LRVRDTGSGIIPKDLEHVFDLFYQGSNELNRKGGMGLGLTLVRRLVELHGGTVSVESEGPGKGALFTVRLPAIEAELEDARSIDRKLQPVPKRTILLVEDNKDAR